MEILLLTFCLLVMVANQLTTCKKKSKDKTTPPTSKTNEPLDNKPKERESSKKPTKILSGEESKSKVEALKKDETSKQVEVKPEGPEKQLFEKVCREKPLVSLDKTQEEASLALTKKKQNEKASKVEADDGYENCPEMTDQQLAKIAAEARI